MVNTNDEKFQKKLLAAFRGEAEEYLAALSDGLIELEKDASSKAALNQLEIIYRVVHSMKGASRAVHLSMVESLCVSLENIFMQFKKRQFDLAPKDFDVLHKTIDFMRDTIEATCDTSYSDQENHSRAGLLLQALRDIHHQPEIAKKESEQVTDRGSLESVVPDNEEISIPAPAPDTVRIQLTKLDALLAQSEGLLSVKLSLEKHQEALRELSYGLEQSRTSLRRRLDLMNKVHKVNGSGRRDSSGQATKYRLDQISFLHDRYTQLREFERNLQELSNRFSQDRKVFNTSLSTMNGEIRKLMMRPFTSVLQAMPRMVRDLARDQDKEVHLRISGAELEIDRRILDEIKDPLIHIIRNSIDHGIEKREERMGLNKAGEGILEITISPVSHNMIELTVKDDGRGINAEAVAAQAVKMGILTQEEAKQRNMTEVRELIFHSGLSTSQLITEISGRGLGMAIVREKVEKLGGHIEVESTKGDYTTIRMQLPYTLGSIRGIIIEAKGRTFALPSGFVTRLIRKSTGVLKTIENKPIISYNEQNLSVITLDPLLGTDPKRKAGENFSYPILILKHGNKKMALQVDTVNKEMEILVKTFCAPLNHVQYFEGVSIMGDGSLIPVFHVPDLFSSIEEGSFQDSRLPSPSKDIAKAPEVLVAEDSLTARMLLHNMLESAGYQVESAKDGAEAFDLLKNKSFDLLVSDVEMPGMDGFELTRRIRQDPKLGKLPVILVTALKSNEDRAKGLKAGANAYMEKGRFDPQIFLEMISTIV